MARVKTQKPSTNALPEPETSSGSDQQLTSSSAASSSSSSSGDEEEENKTPSTPPPPSKKSTTVSTTAANKKITPQSPSSSDDSPPVAKLKSINNTVKPRSKSSGKRILENNKEEKDKRVKKEKSLSAEESPKKLFQRVFSGEDEIAMLKGLIEFKKRKGGDPMNYDDEFYSFMKKLLHVEVNKGQIVDKVRRLKKKFHNNAKKKNITNEHEKKLFALSKKVWEVEMDDDDAEEEKNREDNVNVGVKTLNNGVVVADKNEKMKVKKKEDGAKKGDDEVFIFKVGEIEVKEGMRLEALRRMGVEGRDAIREMWRKVEIAQLEVDLMRNEARVEETKRIMEALKR